MSSQQHRRNISQLETIRTKLQEHGTTPSLLLAPVESLENQSCEDPTATKEAVMSGERSKDYKIQPTYASNPMAES